MWRPTVWRDVELAIGTLTEGPDLDFKRELSSNSEISKDIAAMTLLGGVIVYGIDEDDQGRAAALNKIALQGVPEKIQLLVDTTISPAPNVEVHALREDPADDVGIVVVVIPQSMLTPHMARDRFPARAGAVTRYLTEQEVSTLYAQREATRAVSQSHETLRLFDEPTGGLPSVVGIGVLRLAVSPFTPARHPLGARLKQPLEEAVRDSLPAINGVIAQHLTPKAYDFLMSWSPRGTQGWQAGFSSSNYQEVERAVPVSATCSHDLRFSFAASIPLTGDDGSSRCAFEHIWVAEAMAFIAIAGVFFSQVPGVTLLRIEVGLQNFDGSVSWASSRGRAFHQDQLRISDGDYRECIEAGVRECAVDPRVLANRVLDRLLASFLEPSQDPFAALSRGL
jgi:hypothetical protein